MAMNASVKKNEKLIVWSKETGFMWAWALEDKLQHDGLSGFMVELNSAALPGIQQAKLDTNKFDVWKANDPEVLEKVAAHYIKLEWVR